MTFKTQTALATVALVSSLALTACGGGGGGSSNNTGAAVTASSPTGASAPSGASGAQTATSANVATPQYTASSAQLAAFNLLNQERQQCGFGEVTENTTLDQAAQAHAAYMAENGTITDSEVTGNPGFTGTSFLTRAEHFGYPTGVLATGASAGFYTNATLTETQYGQQIMYGWLSGVYHMAVAVWPVTEVGVGWNETTFNGFPEIQAALEIANPQTGTGNGPLTFPCQGVTGVAYSTGGETPTPPNVSGNWGTPIAVAGLSMSDTVVLQSGTATDPHGNVISLNLLDSANDPNNALQPFEAVAYPTSPLQPNTVYSVSVTGTDNGVAFSRSFTFTTGNIVG